MSKRSRDSLRPKAAVKKVVAKMESVVRKYFILRRQNYFLLSDVMDGSDFVFCVCLRDEFCSTVGVLFGDFTDEGNQEGSAGKNETRCGMMLYSAMFEKLATTDMVHMFVRWATSGR